MTETQLNDMTDEQVLDLARSHPNLLVKELAARLSLREEPDDSDDDHPAYKRGYEAGLNFIPKG